MKSLTFNIDDNEIEYGGRFKNIKWKNAQLELFVKFKEIKQNIWIQIYHVYLDNLGNVISIGFRITPESSFYHEYPNIEFDMNGFIIGDLKTELKNIKKH